MTLGLRKREHAFECITHIIQVITIHNIYKYMYYTHTHKHTQPVQWHCSLVEIGEKWVFFIFL